MWLNFYFLKPGGSPLPPLVTEDEPQDHLSSGRAVIVPVVLHVGGVKVVGGLTVCSHQELQKL